MNNKSAGIPESRIFEDIPSWAVYYMAYGEPSGDMTEGDIAMTDKWMKDNRIDHLVEASDETHFCHHPAFGLGADCVTASFLLRTPERKAEVEKKTIRSRHHDEGYTPGR